AGWARPARDGPALRSLRDAIARRSRDQRPAAETEEGEEEGRSGEGDRQAEDDLDQAPEAAGRLAEGERQPGGDDDDHRDDLGDRPLDRIEDLLKRLLPGHSGAGGLGRG